MPPPAAGELLPLVYGELRKLAAARMAEERGTSTLQATALVHEVKALGAVNSATRTADQTQLALLWQALGLIEENRIMRQVAPPENDLVDNARLFALGNIALADALIAGFDCKYTYKFWRPYHAIRLVNSAGNAAAVEDPNWTALVLAPRHQEYLANPLT